MATLTRRQAIEVLGTAAVGAGVGAVGASNVLAAGSPARATLRQSVCRSCFGRVALPDMLRGAAVVGLPAVDLLHEDEWPIARRYGLAVSTGYGGAGTFTDGLNDPANHNTIVRNLEQSLPRAARAGVSNIIAFVGSRRGLSDEQGIAQSIAALMRVASVAEGEDVTIVIELLNSTVDYPGYQGDHLAFGVELVERVDSPRVKLLYDVYHLQIMDGDVIRSIRDHHRQIGHVHTAGVPGRGAIGRTQELNYPAIFRALADTGYAGYVAHELAPTSDPLTSLREAVAICDV